MSVKEQVASYKSQVIELKKKIRDTDNEMKGIFISELKKVNEENEFGFDSIKVYINNHEFNDGDETYFGFYWDDCTFYRDGNEVDLEDSEKFTTVFEEFEKIDDECWERWFGEESGRFEIKLKS